MQTILEKSTLPFQKIIIQRLIFREMCSFLNKSLQKTCKTPFLCSIFVLDFVKTVDITLKNTEISGLKNPIFA